MHGFVGMTADECNKNPLQEYISHAVEQWCGEGEGQADLEKAWELRSIRTVSGRRRWICSCSSIGSGSCQLVMQGPVAHDPLGALERRP